MTDTEQGTLPPGVDGTVPTTARTYDALLGGSEHSVADQHAADIFVQHIPQARECARDNRDALIRGVRYLVREAGMEQLLDIGCGLPTQQNTHQVAQEINPAVRVAYVDHDPMVRVHGQALLAANRSTTLVTADLRDPEGILAHPDIQSFIDFDRPVGLMVIGMIMQISDDEDPDEILETLMDALPSGSHLFITSWPDTGHPAQRALSDACIETLGNGWIRPVTQLRAHFLDLDLVAPGLEYLARWYPEDPDAPIRPLADLEPYERTQMAGIARKP